MGIKTVPQPPYCPDIAACDFWLFPKLRGCRYEEMKEAVTKVIDTLTQKDIHGAFQKLLERYNVYCSRRRLLRRGLEFHVCTINKVPIRKKSLETYLMILVYIYRKGVQKVQRLTQILDLLLHSITYTEIRTEIWIRFYSRKRNGSFVATKMFSYGSSSRGSLKLFERPSQIWLIHIHSHIHNIYLHIHNIY